MTIVDYPSFEKFVDSECRSNLGQSLNDLPVFVRLQDYYEENLSIKEAREKAKEFVQDLKTYLEE